MSDPAAAFSAIAERLLREPGVSEGTVAGRPLKAWITVSESAESQWPALASEALAFVGGGVVP